MQQETIIRHPRKEDGLAVFNLVKNSPPLDLNSSYYYFMMCADFADTSILAEQDGEIIGYISGYIPPNDPTTLFIWQVAVAQSARGKGLATALLSTLVNEIKEAAKITQITTTISPSNKPSQTLFIRYAESNSVSLIKTPFLEAEDFGPGEGHEAEILYTISVK